MVPTDELEDWQPARRARRVALWGGAVVGVALVVAFLLRPAPESDAGKRIDFELRLLDGSGTLTDEDLIGAPVVLNFWASWCGPCRAEAKLLEETFERYRDEGVQFLGVNIRDQDGPARDFVEQFDISYPTVRDPDQELARRLDVFGLPVTYFVDHEGRLVTTGSGAELGRRGETQVLGAISESDLVAGIERLLEGWDR